MTNSIQNAILSTFLWLDISEYQKTDLFDLEPNAFDTELQKRVCKLINEEIQSQEYFFGYKREIFDEKIKGTVWADDWLEILSQTPLGLKAAKRYYDDLVLKKRLEFLI